MKSAGVVGTLCGARWQLSHKIRESLFVGLGSESQLAAIAIVAGTWKLDFMVKC